MPEDSWYLTAVGNDATMVTEGGHLHLCYYQSVESILG